MNSLVFRGGVEKLAYCPRCEATCGCGGHRVAQSSQAVPRTFQGEDFVDMGFWCWCCFSQTWNFLNQDTKVWLETLASNAGCWVRSTSMHRDLKKVISDWEQGCLQLHFGCEWKALNDETTMSLKKARFVGDLPFAVNYSDGQAVALSAGVGRLIERAVAKDARALRR